MFSAEETAKSLQKAMKGIGTDESRIVREICSTTKAQRQEVKRAYLTMYGKNLEDDIKSEISGNFLKGVLALLMPNDQYEAQCLRFAMKGIGTNEKVLIELLCSKGAFEIQHLSQTYKKMFDRDLVEDIKSEQSGDLGRLLVSLASGGRDNSQTANIDLAVKEANLLYEAGEGKVGTDELEFIRIFCSRSFAQLKATFEAYESQNKKTPIEKAIQKETSGKFERALLAFVKTVRNKPGYWAELLHESMKGLGTNNEDLIRILVSRSEIDLAQIKHQYLQLYGKTLHDAVKSELSGDYQKLFLTLIDAAQ